MAALRLLNLRVQKCQGILMSDFKIFSLMNGQCKRSFINHVDTGHGQISILLHKTYLVKWSTKGGGQRCLKFCPLGSWTRTAPNVDLQQCN